VLLCLVPSRLYTGGGLFAVELAFEIYEIRLGYRCKLNELAWLKIDDWLASMLGGDSKLSLT
jgi:hypothetical protein